MLIMMIFIKYVIHSIAINTIFMANIFAEKNLLNNLNLKLYENDKKYL